MKTSLTFSTFGSIENFKYEFEFLSKKSYLMELTFILSGYLRDFELSSATILSPIKMKT